MSELSLTNVTDKDLPLFSFRGTKTLAKVVKVVDGDTCRIVFSKDSHLIKVTVRLADYNSPELRSTDSDQKQAAYRAKARLKQLVDNQLVWAELGKDGKYGRPLARLYLLDENNNADQCINELMVQEGHGRPYMVTHDLDYVI